MSTFKIKAELNSYHGQIIKTEVSYQIRKMCQTSGTSYPIEIPSILFSVDLLSSTMINPEISSYEPRVLLSTIAFDRTTPSIFLSISLKDQSSLFPSSIPTTSPTVPFTGSPIIPFNTSSRTLEIPESICQHLLNTQTLCKFELPLFCENLLFSYEPFQHYHPVKSKLGKVFLPTSPGIYRVAQVAMLPINVPPVRSPQDQPSPPRQELSRSHRQDVSKPTVQDRDYRSTAIDSITQSLQSFDLQRPSMGIVPPVPPLGQNPEPLATSNDNAPVPPELPLLRPIPVPPPTPLQLQNQNETHDTIHSLNSMPPSTSPPTVAPQPTPSPEGATSLASSDTVVPSTNSSADKPNILDVLAEEINKPNVTDFTSFKNGSSYNLPADLLCVNNAILKELQRYRQKDILNAFQPYFSENDEEVVCDKRLLSLSMLQSLDNIQSYCQKHMPDLITPKSTISKIRTVFTRSDRRKADSSI